MSIEWKACTDPEELFRLKREEWEIEVRAHKTYAWCTWAGSAWDSDWLFRCRTAQPKTKTVKFECFIIDGKLCWQDERLSKLADWVRVPSEDKTMEVLE